MSAITYDVGYEESRNRLTVAFRIILAIPHLIVAQIWGTLTEILALVQWFIIVFTGKRNEGIWNLQQMWLGYYSRVLGYVELLYDPYPGFGTDPGPAPTRTTIAYEETANRLTSGLRFIWIIPAAIIGLGVGIAALAVILVSWFSIVITGKQSRGMWDFVLKALRFSLQVSAYAYLMTDVYPKFGEGAGSSAPAPPPPSAGSSFVPPPPPPA